MTKKTIYLASPYGFSKQWNEKLIPEFIIELEKLEDLLIKLVKIREVII